MPSYHGSSVIGNMFKCIANLFYKVYISLFLYINIHRYSEVLISKFQDKILNDAR